MGTEILNRLSLYTMPKHNNALHNVHLRKHWQKWVKTNYHQPMTKLRRLKARKAKAAAVFPRPIKSLRPTVRGCTKRYNRRTRAGKGFTVQELAQAGISKIFAKTIGISVDHRRTNRSIESKQANVNRLKAYKEKLVLLPRISGVPKQGGKGGVSDATNEQVENLVQVNMNSVMPITQDTKRIAGMAITKEMTAFKAHRQIRQEWSNKKQFGKREKERNKIVEE